VLPIRAVAAVQRAAQPVAGSPPAAGAGTADCPPSRFDFVLTATGARLTTPWCRWAGRGEEERDATTALAGAGRAVAGAGAPRPGTSACAGNPDTAVAVPAMSPTTAYRSRDRRRYAAARFMPLANRRDVNAS